jgi:23S rRNA (cytosine1962-C5)-methyltransferase
LPLDRRLLAAALDRRRPLLERLAGDGTDCYRLFHGIAEGAPGIAIDRYGPILLVQTWREPLAEGDLDRLGQEIQERLGTPLAPVWNHRAHGGQGGHGGKQRGATFARFHDPEIPEAPEGRELSLRYDVRPRHHGLDPLLFLDLRAGRRRIRAAARGMSVLNLFAYTCSSGVAASSGGAREVWNVDFSKTALDVGRTNLERNALSLESTRFIAEDAIAVSRQLAGLPVSSSRGRGPSRRERRFTRFEPRSFDLTILDPPRWSRGVFGAVDVVRDYATLLKPALLLTAEGGVLLTTNHAPEVARDSFLRVLERTVQKNGRSIRALEWILPEDDFPSFDDAPPLKAAWMEL